MAAAAAPNDESCRNRRKRPCGNHPDVGHASYAVKVQQQFRSAERRNPPVIE
jgi:hypothetical protein